MWSDIPPKKLEDPVSYLFRRQKMGFTIWMNPACTHTYMYKYICAAGTCRDKGHEACCKCWCVYSVYML